MRATLLVALFLGCGTDDLAVASCNSFGAGRGKGPSFRRGRRELPVIPGRSVLVFNGNEDHQNGSSPEFFGYVGAGVGGRRFPNGDLVMSFKMAGGHTTEPTNTIDMRQCRSLNEGLSWDTRLGGCEILSDGNWSEDSPSVYVWEGGSLDGHVWYFFERDYPVCNARATTTAASASGGTCTVTVASHGCAVGDWLWTTGLTHNIARNARVEVSGQNSTTISFPCAAPDGAFADGVGTIEKTPERLPFIITSQDGGETRNDPVQLPDLGTLWTSAGTCWRVGDTEVHCSGFYREESGSGFQPVNGYAAFTYQITSADQATPDVTNGALTGGAGGSFYSRIADDSVFHPERGNAQMQYEEIVCKPLQNECDYDVMCLVRVDNTANPPGNGDASTSCQIFPVFANAPFTTWTDTAVTGFPGCGWPAWTPISRAKTEVMHTRRPPGDDIPGVRQPEDNRPDMYISENCGAPGSWKYRYMIGDPALGATGALGHAMYGDIEEHPDHPNVVRIYHAEENENSSNPGNGTRLVYREFGIGVEPPSTYELTRSFSFGAPTPQCSVRYTTSSVLNGAARALFAVRLNVLAFTGSASTIAAAYSSNSSKTFRIWVTNSQTIGFELATNGTTGSAIWTSNADVLRVDNDAVLSFVLTGDAGATNADRLHVYLNDVDVTASGSFSGTFPASIPTPSTPPTWSLCSRGDASGLDRGRNIFLQEFLIYTGAGVSTSIVDELVNQRVPYNPLIRAASGGVDPTGSNPVVWFSFTGSSDTERLTEKMGVFGAPSVVEGFTGSNAATFTNAEIAGSGYLR